MRMYLRLGEGNGLIALVSRDNPERVIKIPKPGRWSLNAAQNKVNLLARAGDAAKGVAEIRLNRDINLTWRAEGLPMRFFGKVHEYQGWAFEQERVFNILGKSPILEDLDLAEVVSVHHLLWSVGVGFASPNELYGFFNKGFDKSGRLLSFDIGSITGEYDLIREKFISGLYERKKEIILEGLSRVNSSRAISDYRLHVDQHLTLGVFERLWRCKV